MLFDFKMLFMLLDFRLYVNLIQCIHVSFVVKDLIKEEEKLVPSDRIVIGML